MMVPKTVPQDDIKKFKKGSTMMVLKKLHNNGIKTILKKFHNDGIKTLLKPLHTYKSFLAQQN